MTEKLEKVWKTEWRELRTINELKILPNTFHSLQKQNQKNIKKTILPLRLAGDATSTYLVFSISSQLLSFW